MTTPRWTFFVALLATLLWPAVASASPPRRASTVELRNAAAAVVSALRHRDGAALAARAHPVNGVRFSPGAFVDPANDVVLSRRALRRMWADRRVIRWGYAEGSGDAIELTAAQYIARYALPNKPIAPDSITIDNDRVPASAHSNVATIYPGSRRVEYYWPRVDPGTDPQFDWLALRLVFESIKGRWLLVGIIHERWSP